MFIIGGIVGVVVGYGFHKLNFYDKIEEWVKTDVKPAVDKASDAYKKSQEGKEEVVKEDNDKKE